MRCLAPEEEAQILEKLRSTRDRLLFLLGRYTGFRVGEMVSLRVADVWHTGFGVAAEITVARAHMKGGAGVNRRRTRNRTVPMHPDLRQAIAEFLRERFPFSEPDHSAPLFPSRKGGAITPGHVWATLKAAAAGLENPDRVGPHSLRKTFAHSVYDVTGHDLVITQQAPGHASVTTTIAYLTPTRSAVESAILNAGNRPFSITPNQSLFLAAS
jgi:integrase